MTAPTYGLLPDDILTCYPGLVEDDFAPGGDPGDGEAIINAEIDLQAAKLFSMLPTRLQAILRGGAAEVIHPDAETDPGVVIVTTVLPPDGPFEVRGLSGRILANCHGQIRGLENAVDALVVWNTFTERWEFDDPSLFDPELTWIARYTVDASAIVISTLQALLRDMVACALGRRIFANQDDDWGQVTYHCDSAKEMLELVRDRNWLPAELIGRFLLTGATIKNVPIYRG